VVGCRGDERNVLGRFAAVARRFPLPVIMRVTADCPLFDPVVAERVIRLFRLYAQRYDVRYAWNVSAGYVDGEDCEVFDRPALLWAHQEARDPADREHVTPYLRRHLKVATLLARTDRGWLTKTSIDTHADLVRVRKLLRGNVVPTEPSQTSGDRQQGGVS
jgi:spore coat polysaccharide biosynthesis protein SpsF (cytidylyltransferase family)